MPLSGARGPGGRRGIRRVVGGPLSVGLALAGLLTGCGVGSEVSAEPPTPTSSPRGLQGPPLVPRVLLRAGERVTCPTGAQPAINLQRADFRPGLIGGTRLGRGLHRIVITGSVTNETNSPVQLLGVTVRVGGERWPATVTGPTRLGAGGAGELVVRGAYRSPTTQQALVRATLRWRWTDPDLRPCGHRGLLDDD